MENNSVHMLGTVKRDATAMENGKGGHTLDFALQVTNPVNGRFDIFDCRLTDYSAAMADLEGFVTEGEELEIMGHLEKRTATEGCRLSGAWVEVRNTSTIIYVDAILSEVE